MSTLRRAIAVTLSSPRLLAIMAAGALAEIIVRIGLGMAAVPIVGVLFPPVFGVLAYTVVTPELRRHVDGDPTETVDRPVDTQLAARLVGLTVVAHSGAVFGAAALFLLVDTPLRAALYFFGEGDHLGVFVQFTTPLLGIAVGTVLLWTLVAGGISRVATGVPIQEAMKTALVKPIHRPRAAATAMAVHLVLLGAVIGGLLVGVPYTRGTGSLLEFGVVAGTVVFVVLAFGFAFLAAFHLIRTADQPAGRLLRSTPSVSARRLVVVGLLVTSLLVGASAVRLAELRPLDQSPEPLGDEPTAAYATAVDNTEQADHRYRVSINADESSPFILEYQHDRSDRQYRGLPRGKASGPDIYADTGAGYPSRMEPAGLFSLGSETTADDRTLRAMPSYLRYSDYYDWNRTLTPLDRTVDGWETVSETESRLVLELRDPVDVAEFGIGYRPEEASNVSESRVRAVVDRESRTLVSVENRLNATIEQDGDAYAVDRYNDHEFEVGYDVQRPHELGPPSLGQWLWRLAVY
ncbi:MAG: hypothetical protein U9O06_01305 [Euryarchaeota archaeon]|nr:hypothetical protein [Euryarchaeota archaeon]